MSAAPYGAAWTRGTPSSLVLAFLGVAGAIWLLALVLSEVGRARLPVGPTGLRRRPAARTRVTRVGGAAGAQRIPPARPPGEGLVYVLAPPGSGDELALLRGAIARSM